MAKFYAGKTLGTSSSYCSLFEENIRKMFKPTYYERDTAMSAKDLGEKTAKLFWCDRNPLNTDEGMDMLLTQFGILNLYGIDKLTKNMQLTSLTQFTEKEREEFLGSLRSNLREYGTKAPMALRKIVG